MRFFIKNWFLLFDRNLKIYQNLLQDSTKNLFSKNTSHEFSNVADLTTQNLKVLEANRIDAKNYLIKYPEISQMKAVVLDQNLKLLRKLNLNDDAVVKMSLENQSVVWKCYKACVADIRKHGQHRIHFLSKELKISQEETCSKMLKYKFVMILSMERMKKNLKILQESKVKPRDILSDLWILRSRSELVASRMKEVRDADVEVIRPWMGRCKNTIFEEFMKRAIIKQRLLGELSLEEYISTRLGCSATYIKKIVQREPQLQRASVLKIKKILDFLFASGFTSEQILSGLPRVANRRIETINTRIQELNQIGVPPSLYVLCKSRREYQHYVKRKKLKAEIT